MAIYYVNDTGGDDARTTTQAQNSSTPWKTVQKAANTVVAGDVVRVQPGLYNERVSETTSGTSSNKITYVADGSVGGVKIRGFQLTGSHIRIIGFHFHHLDVTGTLMYDSVTITSATNIDVIDCVFSYIDHGGVILRAGCHNCVIRGNIMQYVAYTQFPVFPVGSGGFAVGIGGGPPIFITGTKVEYNSFSYVPDYVGGAGNSWIVRNNIMGPTDSSQGVVSGHIDGIQCNDKITQLLVEANWHFSGATSDNHFQWDEVAESHTQIFRGNVCAFSYGLVGWTASQNHYFYHNTWHDNRSFENIVCWANTSSKGNRGVNNIFNNSCLSAGAEIFDSGNGGYIEHDYNLNSGTPGWLSEPHMVTGDPVMRNRFNNIFDILSGSPARNAGGPIIVASGSGNNSTSLSVDHYAGGFFNGDKITIGTGSLVKIASVNTGSNNITLEEGRTWASGDWVRWMGYKDLGAYQFKPEGYRFYGNLLETNGTFAVNVVDPSVVRFVVFYESGIPNEPIENPPYTYTASGADRLVTAKIYYLHASLKPVISAPKALVTNTCFLV